MSETQGHLEAGFLSRYESVKPEKLHDSKIQWWDRLGTAIPIPKGRNRKEERDNLSQISPNPSKANPITS